jgi:hypothetical protein
MFQTPSVLGCLPLLLQTQSVCGRHNSRTVVFAVCCVLLHRAQIAGSTHVDVTSGRLLVEGYGSAIAVRAVQLSGTQLSS